MKLKFLEIRDEGTCILALAIKMRARQPESFEQSELTRFDIENWFLHYRSGYPVNSSSIMLMVLADGKATNDPYEWPARGMGQRTMGTAHDWIIEHFDQLEDGDVVDVQVLLHETTTPKVSERLVRR